MSLVLLATILVPLALGTGALRAVGIRFATDRLAYFGWAWLAGALGTAAIELVWLMLGLGTRSPVPLTIAVLAAAAAFHVWGRRRPSAGASPVRAPALERAFFAASVAGVLVLSAQRVLVGSVKAIIENDEAIFWSYRAKVLFQCGGFGGAYGTYLAQQRPPNGDYPLLNPLLQLWVFIQSGEVTDVLNRVPIQLCSLALVLCLAAGLARVTRPGIAGLLLLLPFTNYELAAAARYAHADVMVALGITVALDAYLRWRADARSAWVALASLGAAFALWSKHDAELYVLAFLAAALALNLGRARQLAAFLRPSRLAWCLPPLAVLAFTWAHNAWFDASNDFMSGSTPDAPFPVLLARQFSDRSPQVLAHFWREVLLDPRSNYALLVVPLLAVIAPRSLWRSPAGVPVLALLFGFAGVTLIFVGIPRDLDWILRTASGRVAAQLLPAAVLVLAALAGELSELLRSPRERAPSQISQEPLPGA